MSTDDYTVLWTQEIVTTRDDGSPVRLMMAGLGAPYSCSRGQKRADRARRHGQTQLPLNQEDQQ